MSNIQLIIQNGALIQQCAVEEGVVWETGRRKTIGTLTFVVLKDAALNFQEGNLVTFIYAGTVIFKGYVYTKQRQNNDKIKVIAHDLLRAFKNKDTYVYANKTAAALLKMIIADFKLKYANVVDTKYAVPAAVEDNKELFEIVQNALDETTYATGVTYVLYADPKGINLVSLKDMKVDILIDETTAESFNYTTSIDSNTYNRIKLIYENKDKGKREIYIAEDTTNQNKWGILQYIETLQTNKNAKLKADTLLSLYNKKTRNLSVRNVQGDIRVRGGSVVPIKLSLGDIAIANYMLVDTAKHTFKESEHMMDITLTGGEFIA